MHTTRTDAKLLCLASVLCPRVRKREHDKRGPDRNAQKQHEIVRQGTRTTCGNNNETKRNGFHTKRILLRRVPVDGFGHIVLCVCVLLSCSNNVAWLAWTKRIFSRANECQPVMSVCEMLLSRQLYAGIHRQGPRIVNRSSSTCIIVRVMCCFVCVCACVTQKGYACGFSRISILPLTACERVARQRICVSSNDNVIPSIQRCNVNSQRYSTTSPTICIAFSCLQASLQCGGIAL